MITICITGLVISSKYAEVPTIHSTLAVNPLGHQSFRQFNILKKRAVYL